MENPDLKKLDVLLGEWDLQASFNDQGFMGRVWSTFEWQGAILVQRSYGEIKPEAPQEWQQSMPFPVTSMIGLDDASGQFTMLYTDGRGVYRVYQMTLDERVWTIWRDAPGFNQRFTGTIGADGTTIPSKWEFSENGQDWRLDFELTYTRVK